MANHTVSMVSRDLHGANAKRKCILATFVMT